MKKLISIVVSMLFVLSVSGLAFAQAKPREFSYAHINLTVTDTDETLKLFRDVMGFKVKIDTIIPDGKVFLQKDLDAIFHVKGAKSRMIIMVSPGGAVVELEQPIVPKVQRLPKDTFRYEFTGAGEMAFNVNNIDEWFKKIRAAGYETQTDYVWSIRGGAAKSFLFYDPDGHMIQFYEEVK